MLELLAPEAPGGPLTFVRLHTARGDYFADGATSVFHPAVVTLGGWRFEGSTPDHRIVADVTVEPRFDQKFVYVSPDYRTSECWNTQVADCLVRVYARRAAGERLELALRSHGTTSAEVHDEIAERIPYALWYDSDKH